MNRAPASIAADTSAQIAASRSRSAAPPPATGKRPSITCAANPGRSPSSLTWMILVRSLSLSTGYGTTIWRQEAGPGSSRFPSGPVAHDSEVTSSSLIASSGGLVTWANSCVK